MSRLATVPLMIFALIAPLAQAELQPLDGEKMQEPLSITASNGSDEVIQQSADYSNSEALARDQQIHIDITIINSQLESQRAIQSQSVNSLPLGPDPAITVP